MRPGCTFSPEGTQNRVGVRSTTTLACPPGATLYVDLGACVSGMRKHSEPISSSPYHLEAKRSIEVVDAAQRAAKVT